MAVACLAREVCLRTRRRVVAFRWHVGPTPCVSRIELARHAARDRLLVFLGLGLAPGFAAKARRH